MITIPLAAGADFLGIIIFIIVAVISALSKKNQTDDSSPTPRNQPPPDLSDEMRKFLDQARKASQPKSAPPPPILPSTPPPVIPSHRPKAPSQGYQKKIVKHLPTVKQVQPIATKVEKTFVEKMDLLKELQVDVPEKVHVEPPPESPPLPGALPVDVHYKTETAATTAPSTAKISANYFRSPANVRQAVLFMEVLGKPRAISAYQGPEI